MSSDFRSIKVFSTSYRARVLHGFRKMNTFLLKITKQFVRLKAILFYFILFQRIRFPLYKLLYSVIVFASES